MIRASGAARPGCSAKVKAPLGGVRINSRPGVHAAGRGARPRVQGDIVGVAPQPLPHKPGAIDSAEPRVELWIAPIVWPPARRTADRKSTRSELQALMRNSNAVFCLKKKTNKIRTTLTSMRQ